MLPTIAGAFRAVADPQTGTYGDGTEWAILRAAANRNRWNEEARRWETVATLFVSVTATNRLARTVAALGKGDPFYAQGEISTEQRESQGNTYTNVLLRANEVRSFPRQQDQQQGAAGSGGYGAGARPGAQQDDWGGGQFGEADAPPF